MKISEAFDFDNDNIDSIKNDIQEIKRRKFYLNAFKDFLYILNDCRTDNTPFRRLVKISTNSDIIIYSPNVLEIEYYDKEGYSKEINIPFKGFNKNEIQESIDFLIKFLNKNTEEAKLASEFIIKRLKIWIGEFMKCHLSFSFKDLVELSEKMNLLFDKIVEFNLGLLNESFDFDDYSDSDFNNSLNIEIQNAKFKTLIQKYLIIFKNTAKKVDYNKISKSLGDKELIKDFKNFLGDINFDKNLIQKYQQNYQYHQNVERYLNVDDIYLYWDSAFFNFIEIYSKVLRLEKIISLSNDEILKTWKKTIDNYKLNESFNFDNIEDEYTKKDVQLASLKVLTKKYKKILLETRENILNSAESKNSSYTEKRDELIDEYFKIYKSLTSKLGIDIIEDKDEHPSPAYYLVYKNDKVLFSYKNTLYTIPKKKLLDVINFYINTVLQEDLNANTSSYFGEDRHQEISKILLQESFDFDNNLEDDNINSNFKKEIEFEKIKALAKKYKKLFFELEKKAHEMNNPNDDDPEANDIKAMEFHMEESIKLYNSLVDELDSIKLERREGQAVNTGKFTRMFASAGYFLTYQYSEAFLSNDNDLNKRWKTKLLKIIWFYVSAVLQNDFYSSKSYFGEDKDSIISNIITDDNLNESFDFETDIETEETRIKKDIKDTIIIELFRRFLMVLWNNDKNANHFIVNVNYLTNDNIYISNVYGDVIINKDFEKNELDSIFAYKNNSEIPRLINKLVNILKTKDSFIDFLKENMNDWAEKGKLSKALKKNTKEKLKDIQIELIRVSHINEAFDFGNDDTIDSEIIKNDIKDSIINSKLIKALKKFLYILDEDFNKERNNPDYQSNFFILLNYFTLEDITDAGPNVISIGSNDASYPYHKYFPFKHSRESLKPEIDNLIIKLKNDRSFLKFLRENFQNWLFDTEGNSRYFKDDFINPKKTIPELINLETEVNEIFNNECVKITESFDFGNDDTIDSDFKALINSNKKKYSYLNLLKEILYILDEDTKSHIFSNSAFAFSRRVDEISDDVFYFDRDKKILEISYRNRMNQKVDIEIPFDLEKPIKPQIDFTINQLKNNNLFNEYLERDNLYDWFYNIENNYNHIKFGNPNVTIPKLKELSKLCKQIMRESTKAILQESFDFDNDAEDFSDSEIKGDILEAKVNVALTKGFQYLKEICIPKYFNFGNMLGGIGYIDLEKFANIIFSHFGYSATLEYHKDFDGSLEVGISIKNQNNKEVGFVNTFYKIHRVLEIFTEEIHDILKPFEDWVKQFKLDEN